MWERIQQADAAITDATVAHRRRVRLTRDLAAADAGLHDADARVAELVERVADELRDVEKLEDGWHGLLRGALGDREERLDDERREHAEAALRLDAARSEAAQLRARADELRGRLVELGDTEAALAIARDHKAALLRELDDPRGEDLDRIASEVAEVGADEDEVAEARRAGEHALGWLREADTMLAKAADWGTWDMFGGGMLSSMAKHGRMQDGREALQQAAGALQVLDAELADVAADVRDAPQLDTHGLTGMMDVFFDNIITDFAVQGRIRDARGNVHELFEQVAEIVRQLDHVAHQLAERRQELVRARTALLEPAG